MTTASIPTPVPGVWYTKWAGGYGLGWSRRICQDNAAGVAYEIEKAVARGSVVALESNGVIRVEDAAVYDPGFPNAGQPSPAWFVPVRTEEA
jgi:hypothetical protein